MSAWFTRWKAHLAYTVAAIGFCAAFFGGTAYEGARRPFVPAPEVNVKALILPGQVIAPTGHLSAIKADSSTPVTWVIPPDYATKLDAVPIGNTLLFVPLTTESFSIAAVTVDNGQLSGPMWTMILPSGPPSPVPPPTPTPSPTPTPTPSQKVKLWVMVVYDQTKLTPASADLIANASLRNSLTAKGHTVRFLEVNSQAVATYKLAPWVQKAGGAPALVLQVAEGSSRGSVLSSVALPTDAVSFTKAITDAGGL